MTENEESNKDSCIRVELTNTRSDKCDTDSGPCACGAWHLVTEHPLITKGWESSSENLPKLLNDIQYTNPYEFKGMYIKSTTIGKMLSFLYRECAKSCTNNDALHVQYIAHLTRTINQAVNEVERLLKQNY